MSHIPKLSYHLVLLLAAPVRCRHSRSSVSILSCPLYFVLSHQVYSINLLLDLPHFLFPGSSILSNLLPIFPASLLKASPNHRSLAPLALSPKRPTWAEPLIYVPNPVCPRHTRFKSSSTLPPLAPPPASSKASNVKDNYRRVPQWSEWGVFLYSKSAVHTGPHSSVASDICVLEWDKLN